MTRFHIVTSAIIQGVFELEVDAENVDEAIEAARTEIDTTGFLEHKIDFNRDKLLAYHITDVTPRNG